MKEKAIEMIKEGLRFHPERYDLIQSSTYLKKKFVGDATRFHMLLKNVLQELESDE